MIENVCYIKGTFKGIYSWGNGYTMETKQRWEEFWDNLHSYLWTYSKPKDNITSGMLVNLKCSIYMHPMGFNAVMKGGGCMTNGSYFRTDLEELNRICTMAAIACGGTFSMSYGEREVDFGELVDMDDYILTEEEENDIKAMA